MARHNETEHKTLSAKLCALVVDNRGETITETLVSLLIGGLALLMLAVVISATVRMLSSSEDAMNDYYESSNALATSPSVDASGTAVLKLGDVEVKTATDQDSEYDVSYQKGVVAGQDVVLYWKTTPTGGGSGD